MALITSTAGSRRRHRGRCFQLMRATERALLEIWMQRWSDIVSFEVVEVVPSAEASSAYHS